MRRKRPRSAGGARLIVATVALLATGWRNSALAQEAKPEPWYEAMTLHAFLSTSYSWNFNRPDSGKSALRVFDADANSLAIDVMELVLQKEVAKAGDAGFRCDMNVGSSIPRISRSAGLNMGDLDFHQIFLSYIAPVGSGLRIDAGKFITSMGYEVIEGYDGYNDNHTRSLLFGYAIPFAHVGVKASYRFSDGLAAHAMVVNGWDNAIDNNSSKSVCAQISAAPAAGLNLIVTGMTGPEKSGNNTDERTIIDGVATLAIGDRLVLGVNGDYATEDHSASNGGTAAWSGVAGYLRCNLSSKISLIVRGEGFADRDGFRTGTPQMLTEFTLTPEYRLSKNFILRGDLRFDQSDQPVFQKASRFVKTQQTLSLNGLFVM